MFPADDIIIRIDGEAATLRPTLLAACRLEKRFGFRAMFDGVLAGDTTITAALIEATATRSTNLPAMVRSIGTYGVHKLDTLTLPLANLIQAMLGLDPDEDEAQPKGKAKGPTQTLAQHLTGLFEFATGNLGWTPATAWSATPGEIMAAMKGRNALLESIFGKPDDKAQVDRKDLPLSKQATLAMAGLNGVVVKREPKAGA